MTPDGDSPLARVQRWMQAVISHPGGIGPGVESDEAQRHLSVSPDEIEQVIAPSRRLSGEERLAIYANAYFARLLECMQSVFPCTLKTIGEDAFDELALGYLERYPSRSYTLDRLGAEFARYLEETRPDRDDQGRSTETWPDFLIELAGLERAIGEVFDGPGVEGRPLLSADDLNAVPVERWPQARLVTAPCLRLLALKFPLNDYFTAVRNDESPEIPEPAESCLALTRREYVVRRHALQRPQFELLGALATGQTLSEAIERAARVSPDGIEALAADLQRWFREWTAAGFFLRVEY
ncbi:MAG TPA: DNA-binding domain-containing protein [Pirellulales bacterium]|nr:DNA-binding domain-containing protein [Pirellulales bacterium]